MVHLGTCLNDSEYNILSKPNTLKIQNAAGKNKSIKYTPT